MCAELLSTIHSDAASEAYQVPEREPEFTDDWCTRNFSAWRAVLATRMGSIRSILEVGCWEGRSALFWLDALSEARLTCLDGWDLAPPAEGFENRDSAMAEQRFDRNVMWPQDDDYRVTKVRALSLHGLAWLGLAGRRYDLIHVDAGHLAYQVYADMCLAWPLLVPGGVMCVDDYRWDASPCVGDHCGWGVQRFLDRHPHQVLDDSYSMIVEKTR